jgi:hypothetical protein
MSCEIIYIFPYAEEDDNQPYELLITTSDILSVNVHDDSHNMKNGYTLRIEMKHKCYFFNTRSATGNIFSFTNF